MTDDRELLERAAQAAGINVYRGHGWQSDRLFRPTVGDGKIPGIEWNPLKDDGDALRLAVQLLNWPHGGRAFDNAVTAMVAVGQLPSDPYAATRRAIVRAAAALADSQT